jgi:hypothetical protein
MNRQSTRPEPPEDAWEKKVQEITGRVAYPPTPDIAGAVRDRIMPRGRRLLITRLAPPVLILLLVVLIVVLLVPDLRARAFDWLHIGAVRIIKEPPPASPTPFPDLLPGYDVTPIASILNWDNEISLAEARERVDFPILTVPSLGTPDAVFFYELEEPMIILVWERSGQTPISLHLIGSHNRVFKYKAEVETETEVNGRRAVWLTGPHQYEIMPLEGEEAVIQRYIQGSVLLWEADGVTYRLEGELTLDEARALAESLE